MKRIPKIAATILVVLVCVASVFLTRFVRQQMFQKRLTAAMARAKGRPEAPIKIVEFIDFQCPACAYGAAYLKATVDQYPDAFFVQVKHFPIQSHRHGYEASRYAECAARQGKFWPFQDLLLARQSNWQRLVDVNPAFLKIADDSGLGRKELAACLRDEKVDEAIKNDKNEGQAKGVKSTPTYFVNGKMAVGKSTLEEEIEGLLDAQGR